MSTHRHLPNPMIHVALRERPAAQGGDDLRPATGILMGLVIGMLLWLLLLWLASLLFGY